MKSYQETTLSEARRTSIRNMRRVSDEILPYGDISRNRCHQWTCRRRFRKRVYNRHRVSPDCFHWIFSWMFNFHPRLHCKRSIRSMVKSMGCRRRFRDPIEIINIWLSGGFHGIFIRNMNLAPDNAQIDDIREAVDQWSLRDHNIMTSFDAIFDTRVSHTGHP